MPEKKSHFYFYTVKKTEDDDSLESLQNKFSDFFSMFCEANIFVDHIYMENNKRKNRRVLLRKIKENDIVWVDTLFSLGKSYSDIAEVWNKIREKKAILNILDFRMCFNGNQEVNIHDFAPKFLTYLSMQERSHRKEVQKIGIENAKKKGIRFGRKTVPLPDNFYEVYDLYKKDVITIAQGAAMCNMSASTFYNKMRKYETMVKESYKKEK